jgi:hypothetical protein
MRMKYSPLSREEIATPLSNAIYPVHSIHLISRAVLGTICQGPLVKGKQK